VTVPLTRQAEHDLFVRYQAGDRKAGDALVRANMHVVEYLARKAAGRRDHEDMIAEGCIGLTIAIAKFDPERGTRFITYAKPWITTRIYMAIARTSSPLRIVGFAGRPDAYFKVRRALAAVEHGNATIEDAARDLGRSPNEVADAFAQIKSYPVQAEGGVWGDREDGDPGIRSWMPVDDHTPEDAAIDAEHARATKVRAAKMLAVLDARELLIVKSRTMSDDPDALSTLGTILGISRERVRQIETIAIAKMRNAT
jgi:RNA polymerase sigma-32 factor